VKTGAGGVGSGDEGGWRGAGLVGGPEAEVRGERGGPEDRDEGLSILDPKPSPEFGDGGTEGGCANDGVKGDGTPNEPVTGEPNAPVTGVFT